MSFCSELTCKGLKILCLMKEQIEKTLSDYEQFQINEDHQKTVKGGTGNSENEFIVIEDLVDN